MARSSHTNSAPSLSPGNRIYLYGLLARKLGCGKQTFLPRVEEALATEALGAEDLGFESTRALLEALGDCIKLTVFKGGRIYATVIAQPEWDAALAAPAEKTAGGNAAKGNKPWKRKKADKALKPVKPRRIKRDKSAESKTDGNETALSPDAAVAAQGTRVDTPLATTVESAKAATAPESREDQAEADAKREHIDVSALPNEQPASTRDNAAEAETKTAGSDEKTLASVDTASTATGMANEAGAPTVSNEPIDPAHASVTPHAEGKPEQEAPASPTAPQSTISLTITYDPYGDFEEGAVLEATEVSQERAANESSTPTVAAAAVAEAKAVDARATEKTATSAAASSTAHGSRAAKPASHSARTRVTADAEKLATVSVVGAQGIAANMQPATDGSMATTPHPATGAGHASVAGAVGAACVANASSAPAVFAGSSAASNPNAVTEADVIPAAPALAPSSASAPTTGVTVSAQAPVASITVTPGTVETTAASVAPAAPAAPEASTPIAAVSTETLQAESAQVVAAAPRSISPADALGPSPSPEALRSYPRDFSAEVYCPADTVAELSCMLPMGTSALMLLNRDYIRAWDLELIRGTRSKAVFPLRVEHAKEASPIVVTIRKQGNGGFPWVLDTVE